MFRCCRCRTEFEQPYMAAYAEFLPGVGTRRYEEPLCPWCGSMDFEEMEEEEDEPYMLRQVQTADLAR